MRRLLTILLGAWVAIAVASGPVRAQDGGVVQEVRVEGNQRIEAETIFSYMTVRPGDRYDRVQLDESLKALYETGLFADVTLVQEGPAIVVRVVENPIVNRIAFEGNKKLSDEQLQQELTLRPRVVYTRTRVQNDVKRILELYRQSGRFSATVEPKVITLSENRVDLVFEIDEGQTTGIERISFVGNRVFDDSDLRGVVETTESAWWRFLTSADSYDPDRINYDKELLRKFYLSNGYADFRVVSAVAELAPDSDGFFVTFTVEEGEQYTFGKVDLTTTFKNLDLAELQDAVLMREGKVYNADLVEKTIENLTNELGSLGFAFVEIRPQVRRNRAERSIDISLEIQEGPKVYVERIEITGNTRTLDKVVRREVELVEGDAFSTALVRRSQQRIRNLGFFENVEVNNVPGTAPDKTVVTVDIEEKSTGELRLGAGFSTAEGGLGDFGIRERNFLGRGQDLGASFTLSQRTQELEASFTEPYFLDRNLSAGVDAFRVTRDFSDESGFDQLSTGFNLRTGYTIVWPLSQSLKYGYSNDELSDIRPGASRFIREQAGTTNTSSVSQDLLYDRRDNRFDPTDGHFVKLGNDLAGLGGDVRFLRTRLEAGHYWPIAEDWVLSVSGEAGYIFGLNQDVAINNRFFLGGDNLRGFAIFGAGPRDVGTDDSIGGTWFHAGTTELSFPLGLPKELGILGNLFSDFGSLGGAEVSGAGIKDTGSLRASAGVGVSWRSPFGPVRVDFAYPILKEEFDKTERFRVSFGTSF